MLLLTVIYLSFVGIGLPNALIGSAWPAMFGDMNVPMSYMGIISLIIMGCTVVSSSLTGKAAKHFPTNTVTAAGIAMAAVALLGFGLATRFAPLCAYSVLLGLGIGFVDAGLNSYMAIHFSAGHMNWLHCFWGIGAGLGPVIMAGGLSRSGSWRDGYFAIVVIQAAIVALLYFTRPLWGEKGGSTPVQDSVPPASRNMICNNGKEGWPRGVGYALASAFLYCALQTSVALWGSSYMATARMMTPEVAAKWISLFFIGLTSGRFISGFLAAKLGDRQMIRLGAGVFACGIAAIFPVFGNTACMLGFIIMGLGCAPIYPCLLHYTPINFGKENAQAIIGMQVAGAYIGAAVMPPVFGMVAAYTGYGFFPIYLGVLLAATMILIETYTRKMRGLSR